MDTDPTPTPLDTKLVLQLLQSVSDMRIELERIESKVDLSQRQKVQLARDIRCLSDNVHAFREKFEPYLVSAVDGKRRRENALWQVLSSVAGWGIIAVLGTIGLAVFWYFVHAVTSRAP